MPPRALPQKNLPMTAVLTVHTVATVHVPRQKKKKKIQNPLLGVYGSPELVLATFSVKWNLKVVLDFLPVSRRTTSRLGVKRET